MVCSPRIDSSPRRSPFSNMYSTSGNHQQGYVHRPEGSGAGQPLYWPCQPWQGEVAESAAQGVDQQRTQQQRKSTGPSSLSCSSSYGHGENLSLPSIDPFLDDYKEACYLGYQMLGKPRMENGGSSSGIVTTVAPASSQLPTLSKCLAMPEPAFVRGEEAVAVAAGGLQIGVGLPSDVYYTGHQFGGDGLTLQHQMAKSDQWAADSSLHNMLG